MDEHMPTVPEPRQSTIFSRPSCHYATSPFHWEDKWRTFANDDEIFPSEAELLDSRDVETRLRGLGGINTAALAFVCRESISAAGVPSFKSIGSGSFNVVLLAEFPDGERVVARIPLLDSRSNGLIMSQVATMAYASLRLGIPTPDVYAWDDGPENPVKAPFIIMQFIDGQGLNEVWPSANIEQKAHTIGMLAKYHAALVQDRESFSEFGSLMFSTDVLSGAITDLTDAKGYCVGPLIRLKRPFVGSVYANWPSAPVKKIHDLWDEGYEAEMAMMEIRWATQGRNRMIAEPDEKIRNVADCIGVYWDEVKDAASAVRKLIDECAVPNESLPCLVHPDLAFRNVIVEKGSLRILSILDWDGAAILPFDLFPQYFEDLVSGNANMKIELTPISSADIYASLSETRHGNAFETRHGNAFDAQSVIAAYIRLLRKYAFGAFYHQDDNFALLSISEFGDMAAEVERAVMKMSYPFMVAMWLKEEIVGRWQDGTDAKLVHLLITRGFTEWCRRREWLKTRLHDKPRISQQPTVRAKKDGLDQRTVHADRFLLAQTIGSLVLVFALAYILLTPVVVFSLT
ncbi:hypothetical protein ACEPAI_3272 [Sanghuangporus weigelae]